MAADKVDVLLLPVLELEQGLRDQLFSRDREQLVLAVVLDHRGAIVRGAILLRQPQVPVAGEDTIVETGILSGVTFEQVVEALIRVWGAAEEEGELYILVERTEDVTGLGGEGEHFGW